MELISRFLPIPDQSFFLFGPRGTGKSTWVQQTFPEALVVDLLKPVIYRQLQARPERLAELAAGSPRRPVVVDEVQRVPELLSVVHDLIERDRSRRFVLTGSSARKLRRGGVDLLAGRALNKTLHPFMTSELPHLELETALSNGVLPVASGLIPPSNTSVCLSVHFPGGRFSGLARSAIDPVFTPG